MSVLKTAESVVSAPPTATPPSDIWESHTVRCFTRWGRSGAVIGVEGELDASNAGPLSDHVQRCAAYCEWLVLDLYDLDFIGTAGFSALKTIADRCAETDVHCTLVSGTAVARLLRICDPAGELPVMASVTDALAVLQGVRQAL